MATNIKITKTLLEFSAEMIGSECWYVSGGIGPRFRLAIGDKIRRKLILWDKESHEPRSAEPSEVFRVFDSQISLMVWCSWRLEKSNQVIVGSNDDDKAIDSGLKLLIHKKITDVQFVPPAWDINMTFDGKIRLKVICDITSGDEKFDVNWSLRVNNSSIAAGLRGSVLFGKLPVAPDSLPRFVEPPAG